MATNATPWEMLRNQLESFISGQDASAKLDGLQLVTTPTEALWDNEKYGTWLAWETWANNVPIYGPVYEASVGNRATDAYIQILYNIDVPDVADKKAKQEADELRTQIDDLAGQISTLEEDMGAAWTTFHEKQKDLPPRRQQSFDSWYRQNYGTKVSGLTTKMQGLMGSFASASNKAGGGYQAVGQAILDYNNPALQAQLEDESGSTLSYRTWSLQPELGSWVGEVQKGEGTKLSLQVDTHTKTVSKTSWGASASASFAYGIFSFGGSGGGTHSSVDTQETDFSMSWAADGFTSIRIAAGPWYHQNVLQTFKGGPWLPKGPFGNGAAHPYGQGGTYPLQPSVLYVAYQPEVSATVDQKTYHEVKTSWEAGIRIGIGPFGFGGKTTGSKDDAKWEDASRSFSIQSKSPHPQVVAVLNNFMPGN